MVDIGNLRVSTDIEDEKPRYFYANYTMQQKKMSCLSELFSAKSFV